ncbi:heavy-metal-associated domain-containing protein [Nocardioides sp. R-C-SC26]|uniref:heavy-metal-associated domain-containing protein n=1 Tax=Nocardioides sp. R-C-SC26 TaxID=2870414 RepID=UPI001E341B92|nr:heavy-metal-associated domain-containing protein [Nocardioides sp. R-C-SC26]
MSESVVQNYTVEGMTCGHCAASVTEELEEIDGVVAVEVDVTTGSVTVTSEQPLAEADVQAAVVEAGYRVV